MIAARTPALKGCQPTRRSPHPHQLLHLIPRNRLLRRVVSDVLLRYVHKAWKEVVKHPRDLVQVRLLVIDEHVRVEVAQQRVPASGDRVGRRQRPDVQARNADEVQPRTAPGELDQPCDARPAVLAGIPLEHREFPADYREPLEVWPARAEGTEVAVREVDAAPHHHVDREVLQVRELE